MRSTILILAALSLSACNQTTTQVQQSQSPPMPSAAERLVSAYPAAIEAHAAATTIAQRCGQKNHQLFDADVVNNQYVRGAASAGVHENDIRRAVRHGIEKGRASRCSDLTVAERKFMIAASPIENLTTIANYDSRVIAKKQRYNEISRFCSAQADAAIYNNLNRNSMLGAFVGGTQTMSLCMQMHGY